MKSTDLKILQHIRHNSRMNLTTLSKKTGIPVSTIFDRIKTQQKETITRFTALVDFTRLGYPVKTNIFLKIDPSQREEVRAYLVAHERVNNLFRINNGFDFAAECVFQSIKEFEEFLDTIEQTYRVVEKNVYHIIDDIAREKALSYQYE